jgi:site-specific recombinase XerD
VERAIQLYLQELMVNERSSKTMEWHRTALGLLQEYLVQKHSLFPVSQLTRREVGGWMAFLRSEPSATGTRRAVSTLRTYARSAHAFGAFFVQQGYLERSPFDTIALPKAEKHRIQLVEPEVFEQLLLACQPPGEINVFGGRATARNRALLWVFLETGLLVSEVCALRLRDVDRKRGKLRIRGKRPYQRTITLGPNSRSALFAYLDQYRLKEKERDGEDHLFLTETRCPPTPNALTQLFARLSSRAGLMERPVSPSMLRETLAVRYLQAGGDPCTLQ